MIVRESLGEGVVLDELPGIVHCFIFCDVSPFNNQPLSFLSFVFSFSSLSSFCFLSSFSQTKRWLVPRWLRFCSFQEYLGGGASEPSNLVSVKRERSRERLRERSREREVESTAAHCLSLPVFLSVSLCIFSCNL